MPHHRTLGSLVGCCKCLIMIKLRYGDGKEALAQIGAAMQKNRVRALRRNFEGKFGVYQAEISC